MFNYVTILTLVTFIQCSASEKSIDDTSQQPLASREECKPDVAVLQTMCGLGASEMENNWVLLDCLDKMPPEKKISEPCDNLIWSFKLNITKSGHILEEAKKVCDAEGGDLCGHEAGSEPGHLLACLVNKRHEVKSLQCGVFLNQVSSVIFSDYRIISSFLDACDEDVTKLTCGKTRAGEETGAKHSQGATINCLSQKIDSVSDKCKKEILTIAEFQADDFHLDRALYLACVQDKEQFCGKVQAGEGRVYRCLMRYKQSVSAQCQDQLTRRQRLVASDYKANGGLMRSCKHEIKELKCKEVIDKDRKNAVKLSQILLCLEQNIRDGNEVSGQCVAEMREIRREMMEDFNISPELVANCGQEIDEYCADTKTQKHGKTIHCLMKVASEQSEDKKMIGDKCEMALDDLLRQTQVMSDWQADPVLEDACDEVVAAACNDPRGGEHVMACLMEQLSQNSPAMTSSCSEVLMQVHYFLAREIIIDEKLYNACDRDAVRVCKGAVGWHATKDNLSNQLVFPCLVRNLYNDEDEDDENSLDEEEDENEDKLSDACVEQVERTLQQRAMSVNLNPEIEANCRQFLHTVCLSHVNPGEELGCLQEHLETLDNQCRKIVEVYTKIESRNPYLHPVISKACSNVIERKCGSQAKSMDGTGVMECLVRHKVEHPAGSKGAMNNKCRVVVEQWQILTMKNWRFSFKFKQACKGDIQDHCKDPKPKKKQDVIQCLVEVIATDTVEDSKHRISKDCRSELKLEMLAKHSDINLDPELKEACQQELEENCKFDQGEDGGIECLKTLFISKPKLLTKKCRKQLFREEQEEANDNDVDFALARSCKREIKEHCPSEDGKSILRCLKDFSHDNNFDHKCLDILKRRIVQQSHDYRLNPTLRKSCNKDIRKFCSNVLNNFEGGEDESLDGVVIDCLKQQSLQKKSLTESCMKEVMLTMVDAANIVAADPVLERLCPLSLSACRSVHDKDGEINECLKELFKRSGLQDGVECIVHVAKVIEGTGADIHTDPVLNNACAVDLRKFCRDVSPGEGRMFACLVTVSKEKNFSLEKECLAVLSKRIEMFGLALKAAPIESAQALIDSVMKSPHKNFLLSFLSFAIGVIFMFGLCFGRVTKRLRTELKNK